MAQNEFDRSLVQSIVGSNTPKANIVRDRKKVEPEPPDEKEDQEIKRTVKIHCASQSWTIMEDGVPTSPNGTDIQCINKETGIGWTIRANGDILFQAGTGETGKACGGRILVNSRGGQLVKTGPVIAEYTGKGNSPAERKSSKSGKGDVNQLASSSVYWGKCIHEGHGDYRIRARSITIDAGDVLTLLAKEKIILQAGPEGGGEIAMSAGKITTTADVSDRWIKSQDMTVASEKTTMQYDPRGSDNIVTAGHQNIKALGDQSISVGGVARMKVLGLANGALLVKDSRLSAYNISCTRGNLSMMTSIGSIMTSAGSTSWPKLGLTAGSVSINASTAINQEAKTGYSAKSLTGMSLNALGSEFTMGGGSATDPTTKLPIGGEVELSAAMKLRMSAQQGASLTSGNGPLVLTGTPIYLN